MCLKFLYLHPQVLHNNILQLFILSEFLNLLMCLIELLPLTRNDFRLLSDNLLLHSIFHHEVLADIHHFLGLLLNHCMKVLNLLTLRRSWGLSRKRILVHHIPVIPILLEVSARVYPCFHVTLWAFWRQSVLKEHAALVFLPLLVFRPAVLPPNLAGNSNLVPRALTLVWLRLELLRGKKSLTDPLCLELVRHILKLFGELALHFSFAQSWQMISVLRRPHLEWLPANTLLFAEQFVKRDNLIEQTHGIQVPITLPNKAGRNLTESLAPLLDSQLLLLWETNLGELVPLLYFKHIKDKFLIEFFTKVLIIRAWALRRVCAATGFTWATSGRISVLVLPQIIEIIRVLGVDVLVLLLHAYLYLLKITQLVFSTILFNSTLLYWSGPI